MREFFQTIATGGIIALAALNAGAGAQQQKLELLFTNQVVTFTNLQGKVFKDAELVRANTKELVYKTNGDYGVINFTNMSVAELTAVGVSQDFLKKAADQEKAKTEAIAKERALLAAEQQRLLNVSNLTEVTVESFSPRREFNQIYGNVYLCKVRLTNGAETMLYLAHLPPAIPAYINEVQAREQSLNQLSNEVVNTSAQLEYEKEQLRQRQYQVSAVDAVTPPYAVGDYYYVSAAANQRAAVNLAQVQLNTAYDMMSNNDSYLTNQIAYLNDQQVRLYDMKNDKAATSLFVLLSRYPHNNRRMAVVAPDYVQAAGRTNAAPAMPAQTPAADATPTPAPVK